MADAEKEKKESHDVVATSVPEKKESSTRKAPSEAERSKGPRAECKGSEIAKPQEKKPRIESTTERDQTVEISATHGVKLMGTYPPKLKGPKEKANELDKTLVELSLREMEAAMI